MPEYVYALHDFHPENDDEVPFKAGERIEVVEKDDLYGDGWWQGRNLAGKTGLFPQSYTAPAPPSAAATSSSSDNATPDEPPPTKSSLQPLHEESETESLSPKGPAIYVNGNEADGEVMKATMTDVQKAIEQLGRSRGSAEDGDGGRSFSFASTRDERDTDRDSETDYDNMSDTDRHEHGDSDEGWHKGARRKLAEKARKAVEEAEKLEQMLGGMGVGTRSSAPPIEVELSDESEGEEDEEYTRSSNFMPRHSRIPEEDEDDENDVNTQTGSTPQPNGEITLPERDETEAQTVTATRTSFPELPSSEQVISDSNSASLPTPVSPGFVRPSSASPIAVASTPPPPSMPTEQERTSSPLRESLIALPSPTASSFNSTPAFHFSAPQSEQNSVHSAPSSTPAPSTVVEESKANGNSSKQEKEKEKDKKHPSEWSVDDVIDWLKSKGFGPDVCEKFNEQEITGDVLLELDVNVLKNEIGIMAFGKRVRIANAIADLRRPPSVYSDHPDQSPPSPFPGTQSQQGFNGYSFSQSPQYYGATSPHGGSHPGSHSQTHSRNQSQSQSHHSYPGTTASASGFRDSYSVHSQNGALMVAAGLMSPESAPHTGDSLIVPHSPGFKSPDGDAKSNDGLGLGFPLPQDNVKAAKTRPAQLALSPSDTALNATVKAFSDVPEEGAEDRAALSEGENGANVSSYTRRRLFGRSHDSSASGGKDSSRHSKEGVSPSSPAASSEKDKDKDKDKDKEKEKDGSSPAPRHARARKSIDNGKSSDRLSIFGGTFAGSLGKGRKPPPRYSTVGEDGSIASSEKGSAFHLPRFNTAPRKTSSSRPGSSGGLPKNSPKEQKEKEKEKEKEKDKGKEKEKSKDGTVKETRDPALLRKRTSSYPGPVSSADSAKVSNGSNGVNGAGMENLKPGQSILDQIGDPDHVGWMKKKSDRYNSWKTRYFVLKGPHMYCLRSDNQAETKIKGYINIMGYKVTVDENVNPGKYGFRIDHENDKTHYFSSDEKAVIRDWMKAIMKATIGRDYTKPVISSVNIPTIPLMVAQAMNPAPRPPSPTARDATQKALRRENPNQLSSRDARVLMGLPGSDAKEERTRLDSFFTNESVSSEAGNKPEQSKSPAPPRPSREARRASVSQGPITPVDDSLIEWANSHLPSSLQITDTSGSICGGLTILRLAESIKGRPSSPPVPDSAFPTDPGDDKLDGLFRLFDFLLDNEVKMGSVSINDIRQGKREKVLQLLKALKAWEDKRKAIAQSIGKGAVQAGGFLAPAYSMPLGSTI